MSFFLAAPKEVGPLLAHPLDEPTAAAADGDPLHLKNQTLTGQSVSTA